MNKKKILLFGATGMAGHMAYYYLQGTGHYELTDVVFRTPLTDASIVVDVTDRRAVAEVVHTVRPDIILNCVGVLIRGSKEHPDNAIYINAYFPHQLKALQMKLGQNSSISVRTACSQVEKGIIRRRISAMLTIFMDAARRWGKLLTTRT